MNKIKTLVKTAFDNHNTTVFIIDSLISIICFIGLFFFPKTLLIIFSTLLISRLFVYGILDVTALNTVLFANSSSIFQRNFSKLTLSLFIILSGIMGHYVFVAIYLLTRFLSVTIKQSREKLSK